jgi:predicted dehydrogenase
MAQRRVGIIIHGATGRIGSTQHLRALLAIRGDGGVALRNGDRLVPDPLLAGRDPVKLKALADAHGGLRWTTELDTALSGDDAVFMECTASGFRVKLVERAIAAGKHVHIEKPTAPTLAEAVTLARMADAAGVKHAVVQDKLFLPGFAKLCMLREAGFFGRMLSVRLESGWFVFDGTMQAAQRPSWNYRSATGGGLALDMLSHYRYMIEGLAAPFVRVACLTATHIPERIDERGERYQVDVDDSVYCVAQLADGIACTITASWATRVRRDDLIQVQIDGTQGSAVAGGHRCVTQGLVNTPSPRWNTEAGQSSDFRTQWTEVPDTGPFTSSFRLVWERFLRHLGEDAPCPTLWDGARMVQLAEACHRSSRGEGWVDLPALA